MKTHANKIREQDPGILQPKKKSGTKGTATIKDNRPDTVYQRKLQETMNTSVRDKSASVQRKVSKGSTRFQQIASAMGEQHGVDTSGLKATHNSSFPAKLNAEATIQGNTIDFAPSKDTDYNIRHEVAHAIDNTLNGTPKGNKVVNGQKVDTTREKTVDRMAKASVGTQPLSIQRKPLQDPLNTNKVTPIQRTQSHADKVKDEYQRLTNRNPNTNPPQALTDLINRANALPAIGKGSAYDSQENEMAQYDKNDRSTSKGEQILGKLLKKDVQDRDSPYTDHYNFLNGVIRIIVQEFGDSALKEFWNGGHIIFKDNGKHYQKLITLGLPLAILDNDENIMTKTDIAGVFSTQWNDRNANARKKGVMMIRRPDKRETSHYKDRSKYKPKLNDNDPLPPQYGVDMPLKFGGGHVLFGLNYTGHTFIQTEQGGFQNFYQGLILHGKGFVVNSLFGKQSGLFGNSKLSEKGSNANVLDKESTNKNQDSIDKILGEVRRYRW